MSEKINDPAFRVNTSSVFAGRVTSQICFASVDRSEMKREKYEKISDISKFKTYAERWRKTNYESFNKVLQLLDWKEPLIRDL